VQAMPDPDLIVRVADLDRAEPPRWAWQDRIVLGYLGLLIGDEGVGKGTLTAWILARLTRGELPGDLRRAPINVGVIGDEDSFDGVWTPRLHAAGADLARVKQIERPDGGFLELRHDRDALARAVVVEEIRLLFFDQLLDNLGAGVDDWRQKPVREALQPLRTLARELDIAALCSLHPNKRGDNFRQLVAGASAFNALSRSSLLLAVHPEDESRRVLVRGKGNLSRTPAAVEFAIGEHRFAANSHDFKVPTVTDLSVGTLSIDDLIGVSAASASASKVGDACEIIEALLPRDGQWHQAKPIKDACSNDDIDERTAQRAKTRLGVEHRRAETFPASTLWRWPASADTHTSSAGSVASVGSVASANGHKALLSSSHDTHDTDDSGNTRRECVATDAEPSFDDIERATDREEVRIERALQLVGAISQTVRLP